jgi:hypothetical protein
MRLLILTLTFLCSSVTFGWGGRGHHAICEAAVFLVKSPTLKEFLLNKPQILGHLCNVPDTHWKSLASEVRKVGDATHYVNPEKIGLKPTEVPTDYKKIVEAYTGKPSQENAAKTLFSVPEELGSNWWRADQFFRLAVEAGKKIKTVTLPKDSKEERDDDHPYNQAFYNMMVYMGLMGHFVGDNAQPFHNTSDYDGYSANHGGIHAYYEDSIVAQMGPNLTDQIVKKAKSWKSQKFTERKTVVENMRELASVSVSEIREIYKLDPIIRPSSIKIERGMSLKAAAQRRPPSEAANKMSPLVVKQMARASYLLAHLWDEIYKQAGEPPVKSYKSYRYPFTPDFVAPDYY